MRFCYDVPKQQIAITFYSHPMTHLKSDAYFGSFFSKMLGAKSFGRLQSLEQIADSQSLTAFYESKGTLVGFLKFAKLPPVNSASLFLTDEGHLEICWEDPGGNSVQFEFKPNEIEMYLAETEEEIVFDKRYISRELSIRGLSAVE